MDQVSKFCEAVWKGDATTIARLVSRIDPNGEDRWHRRVLSMAAQYGDARLVRQLLDRGADVNAGRSQLTPVAHAAARRGRFFAATKERRSRVVGFTVALDAAVAPRPQLVRRSW
jgi:ankyrin repeat protein